MGTAVDNRDVSHPPYCKRNGWTPRSLGDYGDGGAFPEIHLAQYPLGMGQGGATSRAVPLQVNAEGKVEWDAILKQNLTSKDKSAQQMAEVKKERTASYIRYTPNDQVPGHNPNCSQRVIRMMEAQFDPLEPPKFKHKRIPRGPGTPPPPVNHSPPRKLTAKDQQEWKIPPCVSNWKNQKGYTIPLDKRLAADGRNLKDNAINDKFASLSESLYLAERKAREEISIRNDMLKQKKGQEEQQREQHLRDIARRAREQRNELVTGAAAADAEEAEEMKKRQAVLGDRKREIERDRRLEVAGKKNKRDRNAERDISEKIALGMAQPTSQEMLHDARLFNQDAGFDSGFNAGDDERYNLYDKPLFADRSNAGTYKHDAKRMEQSLGVVGRVPGSSEVASKGVRTVPVEFERDTADVFGLDKLLSDVVDSKKKMNCIVCTVNVSY
eukprot:GHVL01003656.1.p1 GENE.GHVL01003656.1~~GHVL01003656.1.p1  ORF type:complete len:440 (+),score=93.45 GHVL01003656.1:619-1938(+)